MSNKDNSGPAFPVPDPFRLKPQNEQQMVQFAGGMSLRDYFIAHAPDHPHPWFTPVMPPCPDGSIWVSDDGMRKYTNHADAFANEGDSCTRFNQDAIDAWTAERDKQRFVQWPAAWADAQLAARGSPDIIRPTPGA